GGKSGVFLVAFCARLKTYGAFFGDKNHKAFSRFCLCGHEKSGLVPMLTECGTPPMRGYTNYMMVFTTNFPLILICVFPT
ncbi:hypothetical protein, partial [Pseudomonas aeruginosa]|uniref:hypothetical protein n=1 Tax=Pseudomonas aeruginosa TaxID=287 RepID=UPI003B007A91